MIEVKKNIDIKSLTTFKVPAYCQYFIEITSLEELHEALDFAQNKKLPLLFLGGGSNMLFTNDFNGLVIKISLKGITSIQEEEEYTIISAQAGEIWHEFVLDCINKGLGGIENLSLIPGNVGTSPVQNIGAYGVEIKDTVYSLQALNIKTREIEVFDNASCKFGYRDSYFKNEGKDNYIILSVNFKLTNKNHKYKTSYGAIQEELIKNNINSPTPKDISNAVIAIRKSKLPDPAIIGNAGSFFKNPTISSEHFNQLKKEYPEIHHYQLPNNFFKIPAGWLIEQAGWKGKKIGETGVHEKQALVLVNYGNAKGDEILKLAEMIIFDIHKKFNIKLEKEVNIIR